MEGALMFQPGALINGGFRFHVGTKQASFVETVTSQVALPIHCGSAYGPLAGAPITYKGQPSQGVIVDMGTRTFVVPANSTHWIPTGDHNSILVWMSAIPAPDLCGGATMYNSEGAEFQATFSIPPVGHIYEQFHYRIPAAKGKSNTDCTNAADPNRNRTDVCGPSWSSTQDP